MKIGKVLKLEVYGESHAPKIGMRLEGFPQGLKVDFDALKAFMERRAPGRDEFSTPRREPDEPKFISGVKNGVTTGETIEAIIINTNTRSGDYEKFIPRPGHADYPNFVKYGKIPAGGGSNSGRMTAPMCIAGALALQALAERGIKVSSTVKFTGDILAAKADGDSVGGVIECEIMGLPVGLGGSMFDGVDGALAQAIFGIPGVKGIEFGNGFEAAKLKGSENNDAFYVENGKVVTKTNRHGGILGGMTSAMPVVFRVALKPTPSIYKSQDSVDLNTLESAELTVRGRHDPCIALRARPVIEALAAFVVYDAILVESSSVEYTAFDSEKFTNIVVDSNVAELYPKIREKAIFIIPSGEENKTIETVTKIWGAFAKAGLGRKDTVTAVGGGVTGDLVGFAASTWMRGIDWVNVPTTLLSMVDASYGGKTACDLECGKNMAGAFHPPRRVIIDVGFLKTLPERRLADGKAEMIKHEIIGGLKEVDYSAIPTEKELAENLAVKIGIVKADPLEKIGERIKLNAGHTVAHAIEKATNYAISHGEAVAIGCVEEARQAVRMGLALESWPNELAERFKKANLPTQLPKGMTFESLKPLMAGDKKREANTVVFALPCAWGDVRAVSI